MSLDEIARLIARHARPGTETAIDGLLASRVTSAATHHSLTAPLLVVMARGGRCATRRACGRVAAGRPVTAAVRPHRAVRGFEAVAELHARDRAQLVVIAYRTGLARP